MLLYEYISGKSTDSNNSAKIIYIYDMMILYDKNFDFYNDFYNEMNDI